MADLSTQYLGLSLRSPLVVSSSPLCKTVENLRLMENAGAGAVVLHSLYEEQIIEEANELDERLSAGTESFAEALDYFPPASSYRMTPEIYLDHVAAAKKALSIPVIASLNGVSVGGWTEYAQKMAQAGADALELNIYFVAADASLDGEHVERLYLDILKAVKGAVDIPVALKLSPYFSSTANFCKQLARAGADGLVLFNRFYQPDIDLKQLEVVPDLVLSSPFEMRLPLRWIAVLYDQIDASLAGNSGIACGTDVVKMVMAGADIAQMCSVLLRKGPGEVKTILADMQRWMEENEYESVEQMKGSMSHRASPDPAAFERANYMKTLNSYK